MSEVGLFPPYQRKPLQSNTYEAITHLFTLFDRHHLSLNNNDAIEHSKRDSDTEEGEISDDDDIPHKEDKLAPQGSDTEDGQISDSGDVDDDNDVMEVDPNERNLQQDAPKTSPGTYEKGGVHAAGRVVSENLWKASSSSSNTKNVKKKRGAMTEGRKEKRRAKRRKQRAEQDKQSGVKRLKLEMISKPKTVNYCRFFLYGKCQQGDACKFSHDTVPLTKANPCNFHALGKCLKGVDCPYDHELFKYPCNNYKTKGFCCRGDSCLFSHKMPLVGDPSVASSDVNVIAQGISSQRKQQNTRRTPQQTLNMSKNTTLKTPATLGTITRPPPPPTQTPKGISFLSFQSTPSADSNKQQKRKLPDAMSNGATVSSVNNGVLEKSQNAYAMLGRKPTAPAQPPKGIRFLSFQKTACTNSTERQNGELTVPQENGASGKFQNTNNLGRMPPSTFPLSQSSRMMAEEQGKSTSISAPEALCSTSWSTTSNYDPKLIKASPEPPSSNGNITTVSSIWQEFLFNGQ